MTKSFQVKDNCYNF